MRTKVEVLRADRNSGSKAIGGLMREKKVDEANALKARMGALGDEIAAIDVRLNEVEQLAMDRHTEIADLQRELQALRRRVSEVDEVMR